MSRKKTTDVPATVSLTAVPKPKAPRVTKAKAAPLTATMAEGPTYEEIATAAYLRFLDRGGRHGDDFNDWVEAERELTTRRGYAKAG